MAADSKSLPNMFTASSGNTTCNNVAEKAPQRDNETLVDEEILPVAADDSAEKKRRCDAQSKLQAYVESIPNGTFVSRLPLVNDDEEGGLSLDIESDDDSSTAKTTKGIKMIWKMMKPMLVNHLPKRAQPK